MSAQTDQAFQAGVAALRDGRTGDAEKLFAEVVEADLDHAAAHYNLGVLHYQANRLEAAEVVLTHAAALRPTHVDTHSVLAAVSIALKKIENAVVHADVIIKSAVANAAALHSAGQVMVYAARGEQAEQAFRRALEIEPSYLLPAVALVRQLLSRRAFDDARGVCETALQHRPKEQELHLLRAQALWEGGQTAAARDALRNLLDFAPDHVTAHYNLSLFADQPDAQVVIDRLHSLLAERDLPELDAVKAWFALGNLNASLGEAEEAMASFVEGNAVRHSAATDLHRQSAEAFAARTQVVVAAPLPEVRCANDSSGPTPLIIAGPSRSGKSLLQSWLSAHPEISAADEVGVLPKLAEQNFGNDPVRKAEAAATYRKALANLGGNSRYVVDTHPTNALYLDLLLELCPDAKIIQIQRDPLDLAVSIFFRNFVTGGHWADTWAGIADRLTCYDALRQYWQAWSPVVATVRYEEILQSSEETLRALVQSLNLPWSEALEGTGVGDDETPMPWASFSEHPRVLTKSVGIWKPFMPWLAEFADAYGRAKLANRHEIPTKPAKPESAFISALNALNEDESLGVDQAQALAGAPAFHASVAKRAEASSDWDSALAARWQAVSCKPFTSRTARHVQALKRAISASPSYRELDVLHQDLAQISVAHSEQGRLRFGDFGLPYQSCAPAIIAGSRDTEARAAVYDLQQLCTSRSVLDLGCNTGFLALSAAKSATVVMGVEKEPALVEMGRRVAAYLSADNVELTCADAVGFRPDRTFDVVIAAAVHGWIGMPILELGHRLAELTSPNGAVLFESQGQRSTTVIEAGFEDKVKALAGAGFRVEREGQVCDDRVNLRAFVILRKG